MRIVIQNATQGTFHSALAREIGIEASVVLLTLEHEITENGMDKDGYRMVARDNKQLAALFPWTTVGQAKKALESLRDRGFVFIIDATLFTKDSTRWLGCNYQKLKTLRSITILGDGDIDDLRETKQRILQVEKDDTPQLYRDLLPVVVKMSNLTLPLTARDAKEAWDFIKKIVVKYPEDFERLQKRILGMRVWQESRQIRGEKFMAPRPLTAWSNWTRFGDYCKENFQGNLPPIPIEWIEETGRNGAR